MNGTVHILFNSFGSTFLDRLFKIQTYFSSNSKYDNRLNLHRFVFSFCLSLMSMHYDDIK